MKAIAMLIALAAVIALSALANATPRLAWNVDADDVVAVSADSRR